MITKIFKLSTQEMWTLQKKEDLVYFIERETGIKANPKLSIKELIKYLPVENYCRVTRDLYE